MIFTVTSPATAAKFVSSHICLSFSTRLDSPVCTVSCSIILKLFNPSLARPVQGVSALVNLPWSYGSTPPGLTVRWFPDTARPQGCPKWYRTAASVGCNGKASQVLSPGEEQTALGSVRSEKLLNKIHLPFGNFYSFCFIRGKERSVLYPQDEKSVVCFILRKKERSVLYPQDEKSVVCFILRRKERIVLYH
ncbi:hypothetical protein RRG08_017509 [Elysia crispata]|uniref:Uncharacterized protein n=1 Tax=Elysia crispata TaxID=231223 RepID=A0AAE0ZBE5_9GAST|nr:hypothetical protein RRG08_017509 [Elysia crispata]